MFFSIWKRNTWNMTPRIAAYINCWSHLSAHLARETAACRKVMPSSGICLEILGFESPSWPICPGIWTYRDLATRCISWDLLASALGFDKTEMASLLLVFEVAWLLLEGMGGEQMLPPSDPFVWWLSCPPKMDIRSFFKKVSFQFWVAATSRKTGYHDRLLFATRLHWHGGDAMWWCDATDLGGRVRLCIGPPMNFDFFSFTLL